MPFCPFFPFQGIVVSVTGAFWPTAPSVSFRLHSEALTRFIHRVAKKFIQPQWHNLKSKAILWKVAFLR